MNEPTPKQWERRALAAEEELVAIRAIFETHHENTMDTVRENAVLRVALREVQDTTNWAYGSIAKRLEGGEMGDELTKKECGNCAHWSKYLPSDRVPYCRNIAIGDLIDRDDWARFEPPADFYCNKWEAK